MLPNKTQNGRQTEIIQWAGLILLIAFTYKHFGPGATTPITPAAIASFVGAAFLLISINPLKLRQ